MAKEDEASIFKDWKKTQDPKYFRKLYDSMKPLIYKAAEKASYGSNIPESAFKAYAAQSFYDALRTFQPGKGAQLGTHVYGSVHNKTKRLNYMYQNLGQIPEPRAMKIGLFKNEQSYLHDSLGREPSSAELADRLGWGLKDVANIQRELRKDLALGEGTDELPYFESSKDEEILNYLYYELAPDEQVVYEYIYGKNGRPRMIKPSGKINFDKISQNMGVSTSKVRTLYGKIRKKLETSLKR